MKGYFFGARRVTQITQLGYLNLQKCERGYNFHKNLIQNGTRKGVFHSLSLKKGMSFQLRDHLNRVVFQRCRTHMLTQEKPEWPPETSVS